MQKPAKKSPLDSLRAKVAARAVKKAPAPAKPQKKRKPSFVRKAINAWWDRLMGAASDRSFSEQDEEYAAHRTSQDYIWNTAGLTAWGIVFPLLTIVVTQLVGVEQAGMFSLAFVTGTLLMIIANYGVRTYQVSDIDEEHSFADYQVNRLLTCIAMLVIGGLYCTIRGYGNEMFTMSIWIFVYKMIDGLADVYEGRLQQMDKLYLAGISQTIRSVAVFLIFTIALLFTRNLMVASIAMGVVAVISLVLFTLPLAMLETPKSRGISLESIGMLFKKCFPVFIALFLYSFIDNMPKFVMEGTLSYDNQLYFNALYFPAQAILLTVGFIYKPLLVRMAQAWADPANRRRFDLFILVVVLVIAALTVVGILIMGWIGIPIMSFLYGVDFEEFRNLSYLMLVAGGITGGIDFLYQVITVMRRQKVVTKLYLITFAFALFIPLLLVHYSGLAGAVLGYLIVMAILLVLLVLEYISVRVEYGRHPENDPTGSFAPLSVGADGKAAPAAAHGAEAPKRQASHAAPKGPSPTHAPAAAPLRRQVDTPRADTPTESKPMSRAEAARQAAHRKRMIRETGEMTPEERARAALQERQARRNDKDSNS